MSPTTEEIFMKRTSSLVISLILLTLVVAEARAVDMRVNWPDFMARHDLIWDRLPADYYEGPFVGNGLLGTVIFKDDRGAGM